MENQEITKLKAKSMRQATQILEAGFVNQQLQRTINEQDQLLEIGLEEFNKMEKENAWLKATLRYLVRS